MKTEPVAVFVNQSNTNQHLEQHLEQGNKTCQKRLKTESNQLWYCGLICIQGIQFRGFTISDWGYKFFGFEFLYKMSTEIAELLVFDLVDILRPT